MQQNKETLKKALKVFIISTIILSLIFLTIVRQQVKEKKNQYVLLASSRGNIINNIISSAMTKTYTLNDMIISYNGNTDFFDQIAPLIYDESRRYSGVALRNILVAPKGKVSKVYPLKDNENLIGYNLMDKEKPGNTEAFESYIRDDLIISSPFHIMQDNSKAIAGRLPVFIKDNQDKYQFWGLVSVTMDLDQLLTATGIDNLTKRNLDYRLWYEDEKTHKKIQLAGNSNIEKDAATCQFMVKNLKWNLDIKPTEGWVPADIMLSIIVIIISFAILISMLYISQINLRTMNQKLKYIANRDPLTLCYSRNYLNTILIDSKTGKWRIPHHKYSLLVVDIDYFKHVNDQYGHEIGDTAIKEVSKVLLKNIKHEDADCVIRFGGDEFIVIYNDVTKERLIDKIQTILQEAREIKIENQPEIKITLSIGAEHYNKENPLNYYEQVKKADDKLYISKENGKDKYTI